MFRAVRELPRFGACVIQVSSDHECFVAGRVAELNEQRRDQMMASLRRLHANLGHPPNAVLVRVLKHGGASQAALDLAQELTCDLCAAQKTANTSTVSSRPIGSRSLTDGSVWMSSTFPGGFPTRRSQHST